MAIEKLSNTPSPLELNSKVNEIVASLPSLGGSGGAVQMTHTKAGAVHNLTGLVPDSGMASLLFTATARYTAGDAVSVNGEACGARSVGGKALANGAWVEGAVVSCQYNADSRTVYFPDLGDGEIVLDRQSLNFPFTIGPEEPPPQADGHIWVQMDAESAAKIRRIYITDAVRISHEDGSLIFVVSTNDLTYYRAKEAKQINNGERSILVFDELNPAEKANRAWPAGQNGDAGEIRKDIPVVYSRIDGVLDMVDAYLYFAAERFFRRISQRGSYLLCVESGGFGNEVRNVPRIQIFSQANETTWIRNDNIESHSIGGVYHAETSPDGNYLIYASGTQPYLYGYRREGNVFLRLPDFDGPYLTGFPNPASPSGPNYPSHHIFSFSRDSSLLAVANNNLGASLYRQTQEGYRFWKQLNPESAPGTVIQVNGVRFDDTSGKEILYFWTMSSPTTWFDRLGWYEINGEEFTFTAASQFCAVPMVQGGNYECITSIDISPDGTKMAVGTSARNYNANDGRYTGYAYFCARNSSSKALSRVDFLSCGSSTQYTVSSTTKYINSLCPHVKLLQDKENPNAYTMFWIAVYPEKNKHTATCGAYMKYYYGSLASGVVSISGKANIGYSPFSLAISPDGKHLLVSCLYWNDYKYPPNIFELSITDGVPKATRKSNIDKAFADVCPAYAEFFPKTF